MHSLFVKVKNKINLTLQQHSFDQISFFIIKFIKLEIDLRNTFLPKIVNIK